MGCPKRSTVNWIDKLNFIKVFALNNCSGTLQVYLETGAAATTNLVMYLAGISEVEAVYTLLRPKMGRSTRHGGSKGKRGEKIGSPRKGLTKLLQAEEALPDPANLIAGTVRDVVGPVYPAYSELGVAAFEIAQPIIRTAYYVTIINAPIEFGYDWYSGIIFAPNTGCTQGHGSWINFYVDPENQAYENVFPGLQEVQPVNCYRDGNYIMLGDGMWIITVEVELARNDHTPNGEGNAFGRIALGDDSTVCGTSFKTEMTSDGPDEQRKMMRRVQGPEKLALQMAWHLEPQAIPGITVFHRLRCVRM